MTAFVTSITETVGLTLFGPAPSDKWQQYNWNAFKWGEGTNLVIATPGISFSESITESDAFVAGAGFTLSESITPSFAFSNESLRDSAGYYYVFPDRTTDAVSESIASYTSSSAGSQSYTSGSVTTTSWSSA